MLIGAALFVAGLVIPVTAVKIALMVAAYLLLGRHVLLTAVKNIGRGQVFDENFLMAVATIGAWAVGSFDEAVGVMLFYRVGEYFEDRAVDRSRKQIMDAIDLRPETVNLVKPDGSVEVLLRSKPKSATSFSSVRATAYRLTARLPRARPVWIPRPSPASRSRFAFRPATRSFPAASTRTAR